MQMYFVLGDKVGGMTDMTRNVMGKNKATTVVLLQLNEGVIAARCHVFRGAVCVPR